MHDAPRFFARVFDRRGFVPSEWIGVESARRATHLRLICLGRRLVAARGPIVHGPEGMRCWPGRWSSHCLVAHGRRVCRRDA